MTVFEKLSNNGIDLTHKDLEYIISKYNVKEIGQLNDLPVKNLSI